MAERAYFDWNATSPLREEAREAMLGALAVTGNASSVHAEGRAARHLIEKARTQVAVLVGAEPKNVTFTSGATEANILALNGFFGHKPPRDRLFVSAIEHPSVLSGGRFSADSVEKLPVTSDGVVDLKALRSALARAEHPLCSVMLANNETGIIQPIQDIAEIVHSGDGLLHVDAVQGAGRIDCAAETLGADLISLSSHKLGGPEGVGALILGGDLQIEPLIRGGAACAAVAAHWRSEAGHMAALRDRIEAGIKARLPQAVIFGQNAPRLPNTTLFAVPGMKAETALIAFDLNGIAVSSGSACSSGKVQASHVLAAMGVEPALAQSALRVSLGWSTTDLDVENLLNALTKVSSSLLKKHENSRLNSGLAA